MNNIRVNKFFLLILFSGFTFSEQISFNCKNEKHLMYYYEDNADFKRTYDSVLSRDRTYSFDTDKKILLDNYGGEGPYTETELFLEWLEIYNGDEDNYSKYKFNRVTGVLTSSQYYSLSTKPNQGVLHRHLYTYNCKRIKKLL